LLVSGDAAKTKINNLAKLCKKKNKQGEYGYMFFHKKFSLCIKIEIIIGKAAFQIFVFQTHPFEYTSMRNYFAPPKEGMKKLAIADATALRKFCMHHKHCRNNIMLILFTQLQPA
jgi:hypothetical protein